MTLIRKAMVAGALYAIIVFLLGFVLGILRVLVLVPWLGDTAAVTVEVPVMLAASWFVCRACVDRLGVPPKVGVRSSMGAVAFLVLISAEFTLGLAFGRLLSDQIASFASWSEAIGLAAQVVFATLPLVQVRLHWA